MKLGCPTIENQYLSLNWNVRHKTDIQHFMSYIEIKQICIKYKYMQVDKIKSYFEKQTPYILNFLGIFANIAHG